MKRTYSTLGINPNCNNKNIIESFITDMKQNQDKFCAQRRLQLINFALQGDRYGFNECIQHNCIFYKSGENIDLSTFVNESSQIKTMRFIDGFIHALGLSDDLSKLKHKPFGETISFLYSKLTQVFI